MALQTQLPPLCAEQVEIFVPKNADREGKLKLFFDHLLLMERIPMTPDHHKFLLGIAQNYPAAGAKPLALEPVRAWENLIFGYSLYDTRGYFIGVDAEMLRPELAKYFEEPTLVIKLILTNFMTIGVPYPLVQDAADPFFPQQRRPFVLPAVTPLFTDPDNPVLREQAILRLHYAGLIGYIFHQLAEGVMGNEYEVWMQSWPTQLLRRVALKSPKPGEPPPRPRPVAVTPAEKLSKYGEDAPAVLCVIDYASPFPD